MAPDLEVDVIARKPKSRNPVVIEGFPGVGLVGSIAAQQIIHELDMDYLGTIHSKYFPPVAMLLDGRVNMPVRIYESAKNELIVVVSDIPIHPSIAYVVSKSLIDWAVSINAREVVSVAGIPLENEGHVVFGAATTDEGIENIKKFVEIFQMGTISGIAGSIVTECASRNFPAIPAISLLGSTHSQNPDPLAAVAVIKVINDLYNLSIDTEKLVREAGHIEIEMQKLAEDIRNTAEPEVGPPNPLAMYG